VDWDAHAEREERAYVDSVARLAVEPEPRQKQLVRVAMAAGGAGLARAMQGRHAEAAEWLSQSAECYRESYAEAPSGSWGRLLGAVKARVLAGEWEEARKDAEWARAEVLADERSPIARYAATLAELVLERDSDAESLALSLLEEPDESFPRPVAAALAALARGDAEAYGEAAATVLDSFETRDAFLDDVPVADTVAVLEALAERRGIVAGLESSLLPPRTP
jgi:tetratricopeptide (TPR) repeat protein